MYCGPMPASGAPPIGIDVLGSAFGNTFDHGADGWAVGDAGLAEFVGCLTGAKALVQAAGCGGCGTSGLGGPGGRIGCGTVTMGTGTNRSGMSTPLLAATTDWMPAGAAWAAGWLSATAGGT